MKLDRSGAPHQEPLAPEDWSMEMAQDANLYIAIVKRNLTQMCRLSLAAEGLSEADARTALADKARHWIKDYLDRPSTAPDA